jgi:hypothetical protein
MLKFDHIVLLADDLKNTIYYFEQIGYIVSKGGKHDNGITENALIHFPNGTFLELLALQKNWKTSLIKWLLQITSIRITPLLPIQDFKARFVARALLCKKGIIDFCLLANEGLADYEAIKSRNFPLTTPASMKRVRPDGSSLNWHIFAPFDYELPFVMTPYKPTFKPNPEHLHHPNGAQGIEKIIIYVIDFEATTKKYELLLGFLPSYKDEMNAIFEIEGGKIEIINRHQHTGNGIGFLEVEPAIILP